MFDSYRRSESRLLVLALVLGGCGSLEPGLSTTHSHLVTATPSSPPRVMVLFDLSGSMAEPLDPTNPACPLGCGQTPAQACPAACPTRVREAAGALSGFFASHPDTRFGLTSFPSDSMCSGPRAVDVEVPLAGQPADVPALTQRVSSFIPRGGTPTAAALEFTGQLPSLQPSADGSPAVVLLVTDGVPNCNDANPANACGLPASTQTCVTRSTSCAPATCQCTVGSCTGALCSLGCLDADRTERVVADLAAKGVQVVVVGFGPDAQRSDARRVLQRLARTSTSHDAYFATTAADATAALEDALARWAPRACTFTLEHPLAEGETLEVAVRGQVLSPTDWTLLDLMRVQVTHGPCDDVKLNVAR